MNEIEDITTTRNNYVHANWFDAEKDNLVRIKTKVEAKGVYQLFLRITHNEIEENEKRIEKISREIDTFKNQLKIL